MHSPRIADALATSPHDVLAVAAEPDLRGTPDEDLLAYAAQQERAVVTENVSDFLTLSVLWAGRSQAHTGLVLTNPKRFNRASLAYPANLIAALRGFLDDPHVEGESWIWWL